MRYGWKTNFEYKPLSDLCRHLYNIDILATWSFQYWKVKHNSSLGLHLKGTASEQTISIHLLKPEK